MLRLGVAGASEDDDVLSSKWGTDVRDNYSPLQYAVYKTCICSEDIVRCGMRESLINKW